MMDVEKPTYEELEARLAVAEKTLKALRNDEIDAVIGQKGVYLLRSKELENALREINEELTEYSYALTHNLRAPLRAISNYAHFLFEDLSDTLDGEPKKYLEGLRDAVNLSNKQFNDLETLYNIKNHRVKIEPFEMRELLDEIQTIFNNISGQELNIAQNWPVFRCGKSLCRQILLGLINNGLKFNRSDKKRVKVGWQTNTDNRIEIFVRDNGIGIDPQYQQQIFGIFRRLHTEKEYDGTGIGLAVVKKAAKKMDGTVWVESEPGKGSTFVVSLPASVMVSAAS
jgi:light-regulated signal transduction histidine kinase (bacteriophytochrome)